MGTEREIITKFLDGDDTAYAWIYNSYAKELYAYGKSLGFNRNALNDAIQDIFLKILCERKLLIGVNNLKYYLFRALRNRLLNMARSTTVCDESVKQETPATIGVSVLDQLIEEEEKLALEKRIAQLLECLTFRQREAVSLRFIHEMNYQEIADLLNMSPASVRNLIARAIKRMREEDFLALFMLLSR